MGAITGAQSGALTIGQLSRRTGVNIENIRYFEKVGLLSAPPRTVGGHRSYGTEHVRTLAFIRRGRELGFSPDEVRALLELRQPGRASCCEVQEIAAHHLDRVRAKIADLTRLERLLAGTMEQCSGDAAPECPVLDMIDHIG
ncbi:MerR family transcriptional regulator [Methylobacterium indicum]|uniref:MerR family transcriptional regulator n=1 Tax=Methylobacterium indicum TaxID=1775910 RepID=A0ABR5HJK3_9HYPH|nr:helix-turn-helix domain-containing protein [Methylobacterium indicum]KMO22827.1 MerR family transcriptional regulator [Methylobacterium indicum]KMO26505.1 MerR family transcriptional regulator [Methylobacterium indicum]